MNACPQQLVWTCVTGFGFANLLTSVRPPIKDEFENLPISKQRKYQLRMQRDRRCATCGKPAVAGTLQCLEHLVKKRDRDVPRSVGEPQPQQTIQSEIWFIVKLGAIRS